MVVNLINASGFQVAKVEAILIGDGYSVGVWGKPPSATMVLVPQNTQIVSISPP